MRAPLSSLVLSLWAAIALLCGTASAWADTGGKIALIIGNSKYVSADKLPNPANDADSMADALTSIGFKVIEKKDVTKRDFETTLKEFARQASKADTALFYFAGHGVQLDGKNYFIPVDLEVVDATGIEFDSIPMEQVVEAASKAHKTKIIILDACRDYGVSDQGRATRSLPDITFSAGFAPITSINNADGMIIFYSAEPGKEAVDGGNSKNSPFAESLAKHLVERNTKLHSTFADVMADVKKSTNGFQHPEIAKDELTPDIVLNPAETAEEAWRVIKNSDDPAKFHEFIRRFPDSDLADAAQAKLDKFDSDRRLQELEEKNVAAEKARAEAIKRAEDMKAADQARQAKEQIDKENAAKEEADRRKRQDEERLAAEEKAAEEKRRADAAAAEQARIAAQKAAQDAEAKRLADLAAAIKKMQAEEADAEKKEALRRDAEEKDRKAREAAEAAEKLEEQTQQAKLEEDARKKRAAEAAAKVVADACARDLAALSKLEESGQRGTIEALGAQSACPTLPAAANQAIKDLAARQVKICAADQSALAQVDQKDENKLKAALARFKCESVQAAAAAQIAKLDNDRLRQEQVCADERVKFVAIDLFVPGAVDDLSALQAKAQCPALRAEIARSLNDAATRITMAQGELQRLGCYAPAKPSGRFDAATVVALKNYLDARKAPAEAPRITEGLIDELAAQDVKYCEPAPIATAPASPTPPAISTAPAPSKPAVTSTAPANSTPPAAATAPATPKTPAISTAREESSPPLRRPREFAPVSPLKKKLSRPAVLTEVTEPQPKPVMKKAGKPASPASAPAPAAPMYIPTF